MGIAEKILGLDRQRKAAECFSSDLRTIIADLVKISPDIRVMVFGSVAKDEATVSSDLDVAVILSDEIDKKTFRKNFYVNRTRIHTPIDFIFRTVSEFKRNQMDSAIDQIVAESGIEVYPAWKLNDKK